MSEGAFILLSRIVAIAAGLLLAWALLADWVRQRFQPRRRCPRCWYDMSRSPTLTCSECGYEAKRERRLFKARRRWRWAFVALLLLIGSYALHVTPQVKQRGWVAAVPTTVLAARAPLEFEAWSGRALVLDRWSLKEGDERWEPIPFSPKQPMLVELIERCNQRTLAGWQWRVFLERYFTLYPSQAGKFVDTRAQWPADVPIQVFISYPTELPFEKRGLVVRLKAKELQDIWHQCVIGVEGRLQGISDPLIRYDALPEGIRQVTFEVEVFAGARIWKANGTGEQHVNLDHLLRIWRGEVGPATIGGSLKETLEPVRSDELNRQLREYLAPSLQRDPNGSVALRLRRELGPPGDEFWLAWSFGARAEVLRNGEIVATGVVDDYPMFWFSGMPDPLPFRFCYDLDWTIDPPRELQPDAWEIRLIGDPHAALLNDIHAESYWAGQLTVPVTTILTVDEEAGESLGIPID